MTKSKLDTRKTSSKITPSHRPPIVTIMGHVDHGKTSLLDYIRQAHVADKEAGGITQHIGAYQATYQDHLITFIDTPGHAAFNKMRSRGAQATDIVVLVIAATESVKPQTVESINHIKSAGVPFIVALNKMDMPTADPMLAKSELAKYDVIVEEFGGQVPVVEVSAKTGKGVDKLLEMIQLVYELDPKTTSSEDQLSAVVIESSLDKHIGPIATVLVKTGQLTAGSTCYLGTAAVKIRSLKNTFGQMVKLAPPSTPVEVTGFKQVPAVGALLTAFPVEAVETTPAKEPEAAASTQNDLLSQYEQDLQAMLAEKEVDKPPTINIILKADVQGTLEAIKQNLPDEMIIVDSGVGAVTESDVQLAASTGSTVIAFATPVSGRIKELAQVEKVSIKSYTIIYKLLEDIETIILKLLEPTIDEIQLGTAQVLQIFEMKGDRIAGCKITSGEIKKTDTIHLIRDEKIISDVKIRSLKSDKVDVDKVKVGTECGIILSPQHTFQIGDTLSAYRLKSDET